MIVAEEDYILLFVFACHQSNKSDFFLSIKAKDVTKMNWEGSWRVRFYSEKSKSPFDKEDKKSRSQFEIKNRSEEQVIKNFYGILEQVEKIGFKEAKVIIVQGNATKAMFLLAQEDFVLVKKVNSEEELDAEI